MIQVIAGPFLKASGFRYTVYFDIANVDLQCLVDDIKMQSNAHLS